MKIIITIFSFLVILNSTLSQERLTTILSNEANASYFVEVVDDVRYIVEIDQNDNLNVSILNDDYSLTPLHSKMLRGMFFNYEYIVVGELIYAFDDTTPVIYNYVEDTEVRLDISADWIPQNWVSVNDSLALVRVSYADNSDYEYFLVNNNGDVLSEDESLKYTRNIFSKYLFKASVYIPNVNYSYYLEDIETSIKDTIMHEVARNISTEYKNELIYIDEEDNFYRYNLLNGIKTKIPNVSFSAAEVWSIKVIDDFLFIQNSVSFGKYIIYMYSLETGTFQRFFEHEDIDDFKLNESYIAQGKLIVLDRSNLVIFDVESGEGKSYPSDYGSNVRVPLMDDQFIFTASRWESRYIDLKNGSETLVTNDHVLYPYDYAKVVPMDGSFLGIFRSIGFTDKSVFKLDIQNNTIDHLSSIDNTNHGLANYRSEVVKFGEHIILLTDDIYSVNGTEVTKINPFDLVEVNNFTFEIYNDHITFICQVEDIGQYIYSYDGSTLTEEAFIPKTIFFPFPETRISEYAVTKENVFYIEVAFTDAKLFKYDKPSGDIVELEELNWYFLDLEFFQSGEDVYFDNDDSIYRIDEDGNISFVLSNENENNIKTGLVENNGNCYNISETEISILKGNTAEPIISGEFKIDYLLYSSTRLKSFFVGSFEAGIKTGIIYVEEEFAFELEFEYRVSNIVKAENNHFFIHTRDNPTNDRRLYIFNSDTRELFNVTDLNTENNFYGLIFRNGEPHFVTYIYTLKKAFVYKLDEDYTNPTKVYEADYFGFNSGANLKEFGDVGMIYLCSTIGIVGDDFSVQSLKVKGNGGMTDMVVNEEGFVYFIASDVQYGNQLFRIDPSNFTLSDKGVEFTSNLNVYPNPFQNIINVDEQFYGTGYTIVDRQGKMIKSGLVTSSGVNLNQIPSGIYYLKIDSGTSIYSTPIVKQ